MLSAENCYEAEDGLYAVREDAIEMMKSFGDSFLVIESTQFIADMEAALSGCKCNYEFSTIHYCNRTDYSAVREYFTKMRDAGCIYSEFFLKDRDQYALQNEWRFLIHDYENEFPLLDNGGVNIQTDFRTEIPIYRTEQLEALRVSKDFLF